MYYKICENCGAFLDVGEKCDCTENASEAKAEATTARANNSAVKKPGSMKRLYLRAHENAISGI